MTCYIAEEAASTFDSGIETVTVPIYHDQDLADLVFHSQRGGTYDVVEWLLSQLYRSTELDRVCGLTVTPQTSDMVVVNLEMRQPGRQMEEWLRQGWVPLGAVEFGQLSERALSQERFTDTHEPWWKKEVDSVRDSIKTDPS